MRKGDIYIDAVEFDDGRLEMLMQTYRSERAAKRDIERRFAEQGQPVVYKGYDEVLQQASVEYSTDNSGVCKDYMLVEFTEERQVGDNCYYISTLFWPQDQKGDTMVFRKTKSEFKHIPELTQTYETGEDAEHGHVEALGKLEWIG